MLPEAYISHMIHGRLRIKIPSRKGDMYFFGDMYRQLSTYHGIDRVEVNSLTGSILLMHSLDAGRIADFARASNLFAIKDANAKMYGKQTYVSRKISETFQDINHKVIVSTKGFANIPDLMVIALIGLSIFQISQGNFIAPAWYTALWYAMNIFLKSQTKQTVE
jgi:hypothetical protein